MKLDIIHELRSSRLLAFAQQLKAGKGLTVVASVIEGNSLESAEVAKKAEQVNMFSYKLTLYLSVKFLNK